MGRTLRGAGAATLAAAALTLAAGCGSSDTDTDAPPEGAGAGTAGASSAVAQAKAELARQAPETPVIEVPKLEKPPPRGKTITWVGCPFPVCVQVGVGMRQAADALGWKLKDRNQGLTPATVGSAWSDVAQQPTDGIGGVGVLPNTAIRAQLEEIKAANVPFVGVTSPSAPDELMQALMAPPRQIELDGRLMANWVIADSGAATSKSLFVYDPSLPGIGRALDGYKARLAKGCPDCEVSVLEISGGDIGSKIPGEVVSALERSPDTSYVVFGLGDWSTGVPQAIAAAGLSSQVKVITRAAGPATMNDIKSGGIAAGFTNEVVESGWRTVDALIRLMNGEKLQDTQPVGALHLLTKDNLPADLSKFYEVPGFRQSYERAWGL